MKRVWQEGSAALEDWANRIVLLSLVLAVVPILAAVYHALTGDWYPIGDNGYFVVRARDVLTRDHPLLGAWSSGSSELERSVNNLGPLQLDLLAPFVKVAPVAGTAIGVGVVQLASVVGIWVTVRRLAGPLVVVVAMAVTISIEWSMGPAMLIETRQHQYLVLPFLCLLVLLWAISSGASWALPWAAFAASLVLQTHLSYLFLVSALATWSLTAFAIHSWKAQQDSERWPAERRRTMRMAGVAILVVATCWFQPLLDQFWGRGNLGNLLSNDTGAESPGLTVGARIAATVLTRPPWWLRPQYREFDPMFGRPPADYAAWTLTLLAVLLAAAAWFTWRARARVAFTGVITASIATAVGIASAALLFGSPMGYGPYNYRWLWPIAGMLIIAGVASVTAISGARLAVDRPAGTAMLVLATGTAVVLALLSLPYSYQGIAVDGRERIGLTRQLLAQVDDDELDGTVLFDRTRAVFGEPYTYPVLIHLQQLGVGFEFDDEEEVRRFGDARRADGDATMRLMLVVPDLGGQEPKGARRIAFVAGLSPEMEAEYRRLVTEVSDGILSGRIRVDLAAAKAATHRDLTELSRLVSGRTTDSRRLAGDLVAAANLGQLAADTADQDRLDELLDELAVLREHDIVQTAGLYVSPLPGTGSSD